ncbi:hypothetical protein RB195_012024 [Necator americanus]|uniref:Uncharacterized protein n=1 Tax=Necator americanus TaxID=51031 RepID=A0ABR1D618_NECAM
MFMRNGWVSDAPFTLNGRTGFECTSYIYLGQRIEYDERRDPQVRQEETAKEAYKSIEDVVKKASNTQLRDAPLQR